MEAGSEAGGSEAGILMHRFSRGDQAGGIMNTLIV